jgi:hypothetical protein
MTWIPAVVWHDAEARLNEMEAEARAALSNKKWRPALTVVRREPVVQKTAIEAVSVRQLLLGPDGKPLS